MKRLTSDDIREMLERNPALKARNAHLNSHGQTARAKPQRVISYESVATQTGEGGHTKRSVVRITSHRRRLLDPDNLVGGVKYFVDSIKYAKLIDGDAPENITLEVSQNKVAHKADECTVIEVS